MEDTKEIHLKNGGVSLVDSADFDQLKNYNWRRSYAGYVIRRVKKDGKQCDVFMHRQIMDFPQEKDVDHVNRNKLDNRRQNLRLATKSQNTANRAVQKNCKAKIKGIRKFNKNLQKPWSARIAKEGVVYNLGYFASEEEARQAYIKAAIELFGEFACY